MVFFTLTVVRHGETVANKNRILQGQQDVDLSRDGKSQIVLAAELFEKMSFTHVFSSDLIRCKKTAEAIVSKNTTYNADITYDQRLRERKFGVLEGLPTKVYLTEMNKCSLLEKSMYTPEGGETIEEVQSRVLSFFHDLCEMVAKLQDFQVDGPCEQGSRFPRNSKLSSKQPDILKKMAHQSQEITTRCKAALNLATIHGGPPHDVPVPSSRADFSPRVSLSTEKTAKQLLNINASDSLDIHSDKTWDQYCQDSIANILVVTHGGVIRVLLKYCIETLNCQCADESAHGKANQISGNTGVTKLVVSLLPNQTIRVACLSINDTSHLNNRR